MTRPTATQPGAPSRVLLVESRDAQRTMFSDALGRSGHEVLTATGVYEALRIAQRTAPDVIVTDLTLPDGMARPWSARFGRSP